MIIFGTKATAVSTASDPVSTPCDACGQSALRTHVAARYFHLFWVPCFPVGKVVHFECTHCKRVLEPKEGPPALALLAKQSKSLAKTPVYHFVGLALIAALIGAVVVSVRADARNAKAWVAAPAVGDYYVMDLTKALPEMGRESFKYVIAKVNQVTAEDVEIQFGEYGYDKISGAEKALREDDVRNADYFSTEARSVKRETLVAWQADDGIESVIRR